MSAFTQKTKASPSKPSSFDKGRDSFFGVQAKLNIGKSNDKYEVEANKVADKIVSKNQTNSTESFFSPSPLVQKKLTSDVQKQDDTNKEIQQKVIAETITPVVQLTPVKEEVQEKTISGKEEIQQKTEKNTEQLQTQTEVQQNTTSENVLPVVQFNTAKDEEIQQKGITETITPVVQLASEKEEEIQQKTEKDSEQLQTQTETQQKTTSENITPLVQLLPAKEEEIQQKTEVDAEQVQSKTEVEPKTIPEKSNETIQTIKEPTTVDPVKISLKPTVQLKVEEDVQAKEEDVQAKEEEQKM